MKNETNNKNNEWQDFKIRAYTKKELALMYFPDSMPRPAVRHLMAWIRRCTPLRDALLAMNHKKMSKSFTPKEVKLIVDMLGEP